MVDAIDLVRLWNKDELLCWLHAFEKWSNLEHVRQMIREDDIWFSLETGYVLNDDSRPWIAANINFP